MSFLVERPPEQYDRDAFSGFNTSDTFNLGNARAMMWMSQLAYETHVPATLDAISRLWQLSDVRVLSKPAVSSLPMTDTRGIIAKKDDATIVAFAGTDPLHLLNWI